jgi:hypothetical protein
MTHFSCVECGSRAQPNMLCRACEEEFYTPAPVLPTAAAPPAVDEQPKVFGRTFGKDL